RRRIGQLKVATGMLQRESAVGAEHGERLAELDGQKTRAEADLKGLEARWQQEKDLVAKMHEIRSRLEVPAFESTIVAPALASPKGAPPPPAAAQAPLSPTERGKLRTELNELSRKLRELQGDNPLVQVCVDAQAIAGVV